MGYYGDWSADTIIDGAVWNEESVTVSPSFAATEVLGDLICWLCSRDEVGNVLQIQIKLLYHQMKWIR